MIGAFAAPVGPLSKPSARRKASASVVVVGASGFVGSAIMRAAMERPDLRPIACVRRESARFDLDTETRICEATDAAALGRALEGATYAVNCVLGSPATMVATTRNLCIAARGHGLRRIVHLSSMAVYGGAVGVVDETTAVRPLSAYGQAKAECEAIVREFVSAGGDAVVVRPACVYGPGGEQWVGRIARWLQAGRLGELGAMANGFCNLTFNDDLAAAVACLLIAPNVAGETYNIADADPGTWNQYFVNLGRGIGARVRPVSRPRMQMEVAILAPPLQALKIVTHRVGISTKLLPEPITPSLLQLWRQTMRLDSSKAYTALKFARTPPEEGLAQSAAWFRSQRPEPC
jgi:nucleoside-diphosphate-sugar epimerase